MKILFKRLFSAMLCVAMSASIIVGFSGCHKESATQKTFKSKGQTVDLMDGVTPNPKFESPVGLCGTCLMQDSGNLMNFSMKVFKESLSSGNTLVSPFSVIYALAMTMNGADGDTLKQFEELYGMDLEMLNDYLAVYMVNLEAENKEILSVANSIWFKDDPSLSVMPEFLQKNADYYGAGAFKSPFDDGTIADVNNWVSKNTHEMIPTILEEIKPEDVMYLINALAFEAEWVDKYNEGQVQSDTFNAADGKKQDVPFMHSTENIYIETSNATGFVKKYKGDRFAFLALLPNEGTTLEQLATTDVGQEVFNKMAGISHLGDDTCSGVEVITSMPKFKTEFSIEMSELLKGLGMGDAFNAAKADFSKLGKYEGGNLYIGSVVHKTFIEVAEQGTRAGAATLVSVDECTAAIQTEPPRVVTLDRPFMYMIVDLDYLVPIFIGTVTQI